MHIKDFDILVTLFDVPLQKRVLSSLLHQLKSIPHMMSIMTFVIVDCPGKD